MRRTVLELAVASVAVVSFAAVGCSGSAPSVPTSAAPMAVPVQEPGQEPVGTPAPAAVDGAPPLLAADPAQLADDLVADEQALRAPSTPETGLVAAARRQQVAYRAIGRHPEWDDVVRQRIPPSLLEFYDRNVDARRRLAAMARPKDTLPAWRIDAPVPAADLLNGYRDAEAAFGVGWNYLAAINLIETQLGSIRGLSTAGARGPMQFLPATFAAYGAGGDIDSPHDSIMAAARYLAANGFADDRDRAIYRYNHSDDYVGAVNDYAAALSADPAAFVGYHRWDVYYYTTAGDVVLPIGYAETARIPVDEYVADR